MTKKDFEALANALLEGFHVLDSHPDLQTLTPTQIETIHNIYVKEILHVLKDKNPRFDRERFYSAATP